MNDNKTNKYFAFISYKREDEEWAIWIHHELENYHLPISLNGRADLPTEFRPIFRDIDELKAGNLPEQIYNALASSKYLVVICSPNSAKSEWVNKEIKDFIDIGKAKGIDNVRNIFPFIVDGHPHANHEVEECFPKALLDLPKNQERIGGNVNESGRDKAFVKVLAGMLSSVAFDDLWNRYEHDKAEEERLKREERERFLRVQSRFVAEKVIDISNDSSLAQCLALEVLPKDLGNPNRPFTLEAERALRQSSSKHIEIMKGHTSNVNALSISADGKVIASISDDFTIRIWDAETGTQIRVLDNTHPFGSCIALTEDGKTMISAFFDGAVVIWDVETGEMIWSFDVKDVFDTHYTHFSSMSISPDGNRLALSTSEGDIFLIDFNTEETLSIEIEPVLSVAFSHDGKKLVSTSEDGLIIWDLEDGSRGDIGLNEGVEPEHAYATFSPDDKKIGFLFDNIIGLLEVTEDGRVLTFGKNQVSYVSISFCDDGNHITTVSEEGEIVVWDVETQRAIYRADGVWGEVNYAAYSAKGDHVGLVMDKNTIIKASSKSVCVDKLLADQNEGLFSLAYSPDGKRIVSTSKDGLKIWDVENEKILFDLIGHSERVFSAVFSPDGKLVASASYDGTVRIWNSIDGKPIKVLNYQSSDYTTDAISSVAFCSDGKHVVSTAHNGEVMEWDVETGVRINSWKHKSDVVYNAAISPDEKTITFSTIYNHQGIYLCNLKTGEIIKTFKGHTKAVNSVAFSPDGKQIISSGDDKAIICWDVETSRKKWWLEGLSDRVSSAHFSPDGKYVVASSLDGDVVVCESQCGSVVLVLHGHMNAIQSVVFSPDGNRIASGSSDGVIIIWNFPPLQELIDRIRERFKDRRLTLEERKQYYLE